MRCLTLHQPWASLISHGPKRIETRSWPTSYRGQLFIHAGKTKVSVVDGAPWWPLTEPDGVMLRPELRPLPLGAVVAVAQLVGCVPMVAPEPVDYHAGRVLVVHDDDLALWTADGTLRFEREVTDQLPFGDFTPGRWAWLLDDVRPLPEPVPARGRQGVWTPAYAEAVRIQDQIEAVAA